MGKKITSLLEFLNDLKKLLRIVVDCSPLMFRKNVRRKVKSAGNEVIKRLNEKMDKMENSLSASEMENYELENAGLTGAQGKLKFEIYSELSEKFDEEGNIEDLEGALEVGSIVMKSAAGALPGFGSFVQEFIDVVLHLRKGRQSSKKE